MTVIAPPFVLVSIDGCLYLMCGTSGASSDECYFLRTVGTLILKAITFSAERDLTRV